MAEQGFVPSMWSSLVDDKSIKSMSLLSIFKMDLFFLVSTISLLIFKSSALKRIPVFFTKKSDEEAYSRSSV
jgi:hypothetical protein